MEPKERRFHIILDAVGCDNKFLDNEEFLIGIIKEITDMVGMSILKGPIIAKGLPENPGVTALAIIDFSHISIHTFTVSNEFCLDVFSCKPFDFDKVESYIKKTFNLKAKNIRKTIVKYDH